jgi:hypothetical protein
MPPAARPGSAGLASAGPVGTVLVERRGEGLTVGTRLADTSFVPRAGTDNEHSVLQNGSKVQSWPCWRCAPDGAPWWPAMCRTIPCWPVPSGGAPARQDFREFNRVTVCGLCDRSMSKTAPAPPRDERAPPGQVPAHKLRQISSCTLPAMKFSLPLATSSR